jgi:hypothetical protein
MLDENLDDFVETASQTSVSGRWNFFINIQD